MLPLYFQAKIWTVEKTWVSRQRVGIRTFLCTPICPFSLRHSGQECSQVQTRQLYFFWEVGYQYLGWSDSVFESELSLLRLSLFWKALFNELSSMSFFVKVTLNSVIGKYGKLCKAWAATSNQIILYEKSHPARSLLGITCFIYKLWEIALLFYCYVLKCC